MNKFYIVFRLNTVDMFDTEEKAIIDAKRRQAADKDNQYAVMEAKSVTVQPVPNIEIEILK